MFTNLENYKKKKKVFVSVFVSFDVAICRKVREMNLVGMV